MCCGVYYAMQYLQEQVVIKAIVRRSACKEQRRIQYETEWLFHCLLLRIKSPKAYDHPRGDGKSGILPQPSHSTLYRLIRGIPGTFGLNDYSIDFIGRNLREKNEHLRKESLVWDKMSVKKSLKYCKQKMKFDGFVDYGDVMITEKSEKVADHVLVLMFRPYRVK